MIITINTQAERLKIYCEKTITDFGLIKLMQFSLLEGNNDVLQVLLDSLKGKDFELFLRLCISDYESDSYRMRANIPTIVVSDTDKVDKSLYRKFLEKLSKAGLTSKGIVGNEAEFLVFKVNKELQDVFNNLCSEINDLDLDKLTAVIVKYYENTVYKTTLVKYLEQAALLDYQNFKQVKQVRGFEYE